MLIIMVQKRRKSGEVNPVGETKAELLKIIHSHKDGIMEADIRGLLSLKLNVTTSSVIRRHLKNLGGLVRYDSVSGIGNTWHSCVYNVINNQLINNNIPALKDNELESIDYFIAYSNEFIKLLASNKLLNSIENLKEAREVAKKHPLLTHICKDIGEHPVIDVGLRCIVKDYISGNIKINSCHSSFLMNRYTPKAFTLFD